MTKAKMTPKNVWSYIVGNLRYKMYYSKYPWVRDLIRWHIYDQIEMRITVMNPDCFNQGSCVKCGCLTTALQMANKACDGDCYPPMVNVKDWMKLAGGEEVTIKGDVWRLCKEVRNCVGTEGVWSDIYYYIWKNNSIVHTKHKRKKYGEEDDLGIC